MILFRLLAPVLAAAVTLLLHLGIAHVVFRNPTPEAQHYRRRVRWPARTLSTSIAALLVLPVAQLEEGVEGAVRHSLLIVVIIAGAWVLVSSISAWESAVTRRIDLEHPDNLEARRRLTRVTLLRRIGTVAVAVLAVAGVLLTFEGARSIGASVLASAGIVGLFAGLAARTTFGNVLAGLQLTFSEALRLDDVVVVEGEWGNVEEITLTTVVVRTWDRRRVVLPTSYFVEQPFENWTRRQAQVIGTVSLWLDYRVPMDELRHCFRQTLENSTLWDGDVSVLQMIDATEHTVQVRALVSARDAPTACDLRCEVREAMVSWLAATHPEALPVTRVEG